MFKKPVKNFRENPFKYGGDLDRKARFIMGHLRVRGDLVGVLDPDIDGWCHLISCPYANSSLHYDQMIPCDDAFEKFIECDKNADKNQTDKKYEVIENKTGTCGCVRRNDNDERMKKHDGKNMVRDESEKVCSISENQVTQYVADAEKIFIEKKIEKYLDCLNVENVSLKSENKINKFKNDCLEKRNSIEKMDITAQKETQDQKVRGYGNDLSYELEEVEKIVKKKRAREVFLREIQKVRRNSENSVYGGVTYLVGVNETCHFINRKCAQSVFIDDDDNTKSINEGKNIEKINDNNADFEDNNDENDEIKSICEKNSSRKYLIEKKCINKKSVCVEEKNFEEKIFYQFKPIDDDSDISSEEKIDEKIKEKTDIFAENDLSKKKINFHSCEFSAFKPFTKNKNTSNMSSQSNQEIQTEESKNCIVTKEISRKSSIDSSDEKQSFNEALPIKKAKSIEVSRNENDGLYSSKKFKDFINGIKHYKVYLRQYEVPKTQKPTTSEITNSKHHSQAKHASIPRNLGDKQKYDTNKTKTKRILASYNKCSLRIPSPFDYRLTDDKHREMRHLYSNELLRKDPVPKIIIKDRYKSCEKLHHTSYLVSAASFQMNFYSGESNKEKNEKKFIEKKLSPTFDEKISKKVESGKNLMDDGNILNIPQDFSTLAAEHSRRKTKNNNCKSGTRKTKSRKVELIKDETNDIESSNEKTILDKAENNFKNPSEDKTFPMVETSDTKASNDENMNSHKECKLTKETVKIIIKNVNGNKSNINVKKYSVEKLSNEGLECGKPAYKAIANDRHFIKNNEDQFIKEKNTEGITGKTFKSRKNSKDETKSIENYDKSRLKTPLINKTNLNSDIQNNRRKSFSRSFNGSTRFKDIVKKAIANKTIFDLNANGQRTKTISEVPHVLEHPHEPSKLVPVRVLSPSPTSSYNASNKIKNLCSETHSVNLKCSSVPKEINSNIDYLSRKRNSGDVNKRSSDIDEKSAYCVKKDKGSDKSRKNNKEENKKYAIGDKNMRVDTAEIDARHFSNKNENNKGKFDIDNKKDKPKKEEKSMGKFLKSKMLLWSQRSWKKNVSMEETSSNDDYSYEEESENETQKNEIEKTKEVENVAKEESKEEVKPRSIDEIVQLMLQKARQQQREKELEKEREEQEMLQKQQEMIEKQRMKEEKILKKIKQLEKNTIKIKAPKKKKALKTNQPL